MKNVQIVNLIVNLKEKVRKKLNRPKTLLTMILPGGPEEEKASLSR